MSKNSLLRALSASAVKFLLDRRRRLVGKYQRAVALNPSGRNRHIALVQSREGCNFILSGHEPQDAPGTVEDRIRQRHPTPPLVDARHRDIGVGDGQHRIAGDQRGRVAVGSEAQMDEVKHRRHAGNLLERPGIPLGCCF